MSNANYTVEHFGFSEATKSNTKIVSVAFDVTMALDDVARLLRRKRVNGTVRMTSPSGEVIIFRRGHVMGRHGVSVWAKYGKGNHATKPVDADKAKQVPNAVRRVWEWVQSQSPQLWNVNELVD